MTLQRLSIINYKNIETATLQLSPNINCFVGANGAGKTNVLDAIYFLSFCRSAQTPQDSLVIRHDQEFMVLEGDYTDEGEDGREPGEEHIYCGMKRGTKKHFKRNKKEYRRLSEHIGLIPVVICSPSDTLLIDSGSEERRHLMDMVVSQQDRSYIEALSRYNNALQQRNAMLKMEDPKPDLEVMALWEEQMAHEGEMIFAKRAAFIESMKQPFQQFYDVIAGGRERVTLNYVSHCQRGPLLDTIQRDRAKDMAVGYSLHGIHRDDLEMMLDGHPVRREGSQGQKKTYVTALKLAQFEVLCHSGIQSALLAHTRTPLLLLDDIFDKLDASRVEQIVNLVAGEQFGQIFITDTNREHIDQILRKGHFDYKLFHVTDGEITTAT